MLHAKKYYKHIMAHSSQRDQGTKDVSLSAIHRSRAATLRVRQCFTSVEIVFEAAFIFAKIDEHIVGGSFREDQQLCNTPRP
jgi:hypothetical protein